MRKPSKTAQLTAQAQALAQALARHNMLALAKHPAAEQLAYLTQDNPQPCTACHALPSWPGLSYCPACEAHIPF